MNSLRRILWLLRSLGIAALKTWGNGAARSEQNVQS